MLTVCLTGASVSSIDLLPNPHLDGSWTKDVPTDDGQESDQIFAFDGKTTAIEVPRRSSQLESFDLGDEFTLSTWMKHSRNDDNVDFAAKFGRKEHILCHSDADGNYSASLLTLSARSDTSQPASVLVLSNTTNIRGCWGRCWDDLFSRWVIAIGHVRTHLSLQCCTLASKFHAAHDVCGMIVATER